MKATKWFFFVAILFATAILLSMNSVAKATDDEQKGKHSGEQNDIEYKIVYLNAPGTLTISAQGSYYYFPAWNWGFWEASNYPTKYYGVYPVYFIGQTMNYEVHLKVVTKRTFRHLKVVATQEYFETMSGYDYTGYFEVHKGDPLPGNSQQIWFVEELRPGQEIVLRGSYLAPWGTHPGLDQTHLQIYHWDNDDGDDDDEEEDDNDEAEGRLFIDDPEAGIYCPPAL